MKTATAPPRENLIRAVMPGVEVRSSENGKPPILHGYFARTGEWAEIRSIYEGEFLERFAPGAFTKTIAESRDRMRVLFQHGQDPDVGDKVIAAITELREDDKGAYYEARLFDGLPPLIMDGLRAGQYGASFRFSVTREEFNDGAAPSAHNPDGLPERTVKEAKVLEFGPVSFPAYPGASAGVRATQEFSDDFLMTCIRSNPEGVRKLFTMVEHATGNRTGPNPFADMSLQEELEFRTARIREREEDRSRRPRTESSREDEFWRMVERVHFPDTRTSAERAEQRVFDEMLNEADAMRSRAFDDENDQIRRDYGWTDDERR